MSLSDSPSARSGGWQMWVPCIGMALCSWLSFVDRQVLNILAPTIIKDTGLTVISEDVIAGVPEHDGSRGTMSDRDVLADERPRELAIARLRRSPSAETRGAGDLVRVA